MKTKTLIQLKTEHARLVAEQKNDREIDNSKEIAALEKQIADEEGGDDAEPETTKKKKGNK